MELTEEQYQQFVAKQSEGDPAAIQADMMRDERIANVISQIDPSNLLEEIEQRLRGKKFDVQKRQWVYISKEGQAVPDELISKFISFLGSVLNQNTTLSNYNINEINNRMDMVIEYVKDDLSDNDEKYNLVGNYTEMTRLGMIVCETVSSVFRRALQGMESRRVFGALRVTESLTAAPQKPGLKEAFKFW